MSTLRIVSVSGGKDSTALYCWAIERFENDFLAVFADTGNEHPVTLNYVRNLSQMARGPEIAWVAADFTDRLGISGKAPTGNRFLDMMIWKHRAPSARAQYCTEFVKLRPIRDWLASVRGDSEVIMHVGIRAGESARRSKMPESEWSDFYDCQIERPLLRWDEYQVFDYLKEKGVPPNPLYGAGFGRVGCYPCIHATKLELARLEPWAWEKLAEWETRLGCSWFAPGKIPGAHVPTVQQVREWSTTLWGGKIQDPEMTHPADVPSCMATWGVCE